MSEEKSPASDHEKFYQLMLNFESRLSHISRLSTNNNNACSVEERILKVQNPNIIVALNNVNAETNKLLKLESLLNEIQKKAYKVAVNCIENEIGPQMIMFLTEREVTPASSHFEENCYLTRQDCWSVWLCAYNCSNQRLCI
jgi:hypothetical protein